jgi:aryl-alcohol dehydrogenase-like predicted oxidoreductase
LVGWRYEAVIATKVWAGNLAPDDVIKACEQSLKNLQTDYIDLYQIHWPNHQIPLAETVGALEQLKEQGKIRAIGVSNFAVRDLSDMVALGECQANQLPYSLLWRVIEREIQPLCLEHNVGIICYSPLAQGLLTGRYATVAEVPDYLTGTRLYAGTRPNAEHDDPGCEEEVFAALKEIRRIAGELQQSMAAISLAWLMQQPGITAVLVGARKPEEVQWNLPAVELKLSEPVITKLAEVTEPVKEKLGNNPDMWMSESRMR